MGDELSTPLELLSTTRQNDTDIVIIGFISDIGLSAWNDIPCIYWIYKCGEKVWKLTLPFDIIIYWVYKWHFELRAIL